MYKISEFAKPKMNISYSSSQPWKCVAITLDNQSKRYKSFLRNNNHLNISSFQGIKGINLTKCEIVNQGLGTEALMKSSIFTYGLIGNAASHKANWENLVKSDLGCLVLEDDCHTHPNIAEYISINIKKLMEVDICLFGINTNSILKCISPAGLTSLSSFNPKHPSQDWIKNAFSKTNIRDIEGHKLLKALGMCAYFISPQGAEKLIKEIFPLSLDTTRIPLVSDKMPAISIDRAGCRIYPSIHAFVCQPFLAYTSNLDSSTTI